MTSTDVDKLFINGIDGVKGEYLVKPIEYAQLVQSLVADNPPVDEGGDEVKDPRQISWLRHVWRTISRPHLGVPLDVDPTDVRQAGWGIVFHEDESPAVKEALAPLVERRRDQIGDEARVKVLEYKTGDRRASWLARHNVGSGSIEPTSVPYYLLFVGSPAKIPFSFCHQIDVEYGVGLLHFDTAEGYQRYAQSLIEYETGADVPNAREVVFFAPRHPGDRATSLSADYLVNPLAQGEPTKHTVGVPQKYGYSSRTIRGESAEKAALAGVFNAGPGARPPALLFAAGHGIGFPKGHPAQRQGQGALLCQDWPGLGTISPDHYFAAQDLADDARVRGLVMFCFACFGAGTPDRDRFTHTPGQKPPPIADEPFFSALPQKLLSLPQGGALAFIGHVERAWGYSISTPNAGAQLLPFENAIGSILKGVPLGYAMKDFNERYAALSTSLSSMLEEVSFGAPVSPYELAASWVERNDAEGYIVFGDPAVQLRATDLR